MIGKFVKGKIYVFIDASNIYHSQRKLGWRVDFLRLIEYLKRKTNFGMIYFYTAYDPEHSKQRKFLDFLEIIGYIVRTKKVKFIKDASLEEGGFHKGNLDVELTIDAVHNRDEFKSFVLFSGDSDFEALLKYMKAYKKNCLVVSTKDHVSVELLKQAKFIDLKRLREEIELRKAT
jgi:uncharacterized LabA/DUF88 family protein